MNSLIGRSVMGLTPSTRGQLGTIVDLPWGDKGGIIYVQFSSRKVMFYLAEVHLLPEGVTSLTQEQVQTVCDLLIPQPV